MDWVKLAQRYYLDPAIRGMNGDLADAAEVMFTRGLARAGEVGRGGFIPAQDVELLTRRRRYAAVVSALVESGLWQAVAGGYQVTRWADWQDHLDALTRKRTADRERQRRRRAAARDGSPPSRDKSRDVTAVEGEGDLEGVLPGGEGNPPQPSTAESPPVDNPTRNGKPPPLRCRRHADDPDPPNCGPCKDARLAAERHARATVAARVERDRTAASGPRCDNCGNPTGSSYHRRVCAREDRP